MPNKRTRPSRIADKYTDLKRDATTDRERRTSLIWCLSNSWAAVDVGRIERKDTEKFHGWLMWTPDALEQLADDQ